MISRNIKYLNGNICRIRFAFEQPVRVLFKYGNRNWRRMLAKQFNESQTATEAASDNYVGKRNGYHVANVLNSYKISRSLIDF